MSECAHGPKVFLQSNIHCERLSDDILLRYHGALRGTTDVYSAGCPCKAFSSLRTLFVGLASNAHTKDFKNAARLRHNKARCPGRAHFL